MAEYKVFKETVLPAQLEPSSIYFVAPQAYPNYLEIYVTSLDGSVARHTPRIQDIQTLIDAMPSGGSDSFFADNIAERNAITPKTNAMDVYVIDATADTTVSSGGALYRWRASNSSWVKVAEFESMDVVQSWTNLSGRPSSSPGNIDDAVAKRHAHSNMTQLSLIGQDGDGNMTYNGDLPATGWASVNW